MILVDANLLIYAVNQRAAHHAAAREWLDGSLSAAAPVGLPWVTLSAFLRIVTNPRIFTAPLPVPAAWDIVAEWLAAPAAWIPGPTERHADIFAGLLAQTHGGDLVPDAHLAAIAIEHGLTLCSTDGDFGRFPALRWVNPIG